MYYPAGYINNMLKGIAICLMRIFDSDKKFQERSKEYKKYLIARKYKSSVVKKQFADVGKLSPDSQESLNNNNNVNLRVVSLSPHTIICFLT